MVVNVQEIISEKTYREVKLHIHVLSKPAGIVISVSFGIPKSLQKILLLQNFCKILLKYWWVRFFHTTSAPVPDNLEITMEKGCPIYINPCNPKVKRKYWSERNCIWILCKITNHKTVLRLIINLLVTLIWAK